MTRLRVLLDRVGLFGNERAEFVQWGRYVLPELEPERALRRKGAAEHRVEPWGAVGVIRAEERPATRAELLPQFRAWVSGIVPGVKDQHHVTAPDSLRADLGFNIGTPVIGRLGRSPSVWTDSPPPPGQTSIPVPILPMRDAVVRLCVM